MSGHHLGEGIVGAQLERLLAHMQYQPFDGERAQAFDKVDARHVSAVVAVPQEAGLPARYLCVSLDADGGPFSETDTYPDGSPVAVLHGAPFENLDDALARHDENVALWLIHHTVSLQLDWFVPENPRAYDDDAPAYVRPDFVTVRRVGGTFYFAASQHGRITLRKFNRADVAEGYLEAVAALVCIGGGIASTFNANGWDGQFRIASLKRLVADAEARLRRCRLGDAVRLGLEHGWINRNETFTTESLLEHLGVSAVELHDIRTGQMWSAAADMMAAMDHHARSQAQI